jgi:hypothetical protein
MSLYGGTIGMERRWVKLQWRDALDREEAKLKRD